MKLNLNKFGSHQQDLLGGHFSDDIVEHGLALPQRLMKPEGIARAELGIKPIEINNLELNRWAAAVAPTYLEVVGSNPAV